MRLSVIFYGSLLHYCRNSLFFVKQITQTKRYCCICGFDNDRPASQVRLAMTTKMFININSHLLRLGTSVSLANDVFRLMLSRHTTWRYSFMMPVFYRKSFLTFSIKIISYFFKFFNLRNIFHEKAYALIGKEFYQAFRQTLLHHRALAQRIHKYFLE